MVSKEELKRIICEELEEDFLATKLLAETDKSSWEGAKKALGGASKMVLALTDHIDKDLEDEKITVEQAETARLYISRASEVCNSLRLKAEVHEQRVIGRVEAFQIAAKMAVMMGQSGTKTHDPDA